MKWRDNLLRIVNEGIVGKCPFCKSDNTDYMYIDHENGRGCLDIWCGSCNENEHVDCATPPANRKRMTMKQALAEERERNRKRNLAI